MLYQGVQMDFYWMVEHEIVVVLSINLYYFSNKKKKIGFIFFFNDYSNFWTIIQNETTRWMD